MEKEVRDSSGQPAIITDLSLVRDFTNGGCVEDKTYRIVGATIKVGFYCKGVFLVCFAPSPPPTTAAPLTTRNPGKLKHMQSF